MSNPFEEINQKLDRLLSIIEHGKITQSHIAFQDFCKEQNISRQTGYAWNDRGLIKLEKFGGRQFVILESVIVKSKKNL